MRYRNAETIMFGVNMPINEDIKLEKSKQNHWRTGGFVFLRYFLLEFLED